MGFLLLLQHPGLGLVALTALSFTLPLTIGSNSIISSFQQGLPATVPMGKVLGSRLFTSVAIVFSLTAICTSYAANGIGLMDFNRDLMRGEKKMMIVAATFLPPLLIVFLFPTIFLKAISVVGGVGIALLFGVLPAVIFFLKNKKRTARVLAIVIGLLFFTALLIDLSNDFGIVKTSAAIKNVKKQAITQHDP